MKGKCFISSLLFFAHIISRLFDATLWLLFLPSKLASLMYQIIWCNYACSVCHPHSRLTRHFCPFDTCVPSQHHPPATLTSTHPTLHPHTHAHSYLVQGTPTFTTYSTHPSSATPTATTPLKHPPHNTNPHRPLSMRRQPIARRVRDWRGENEKELQMSTYTLSRSPIFHSFPPFLRCASLPP